MNSQYSVKPPSLELEVFPPEFPEVLPLEFPDVFPPEFPEVFPPEFPEVLPLELPEVLPLEFPEVDPLEFPEEFPPAVPPASPVTTVPHVLRAARAHPEGITCESMFTSQVSDPGRLSIEQLLFTQVLPVAGSTDAVGS